MRRGEYGWEYPTGRGDHPDGVFTLATRVGHSTVGTFDSTHGFIQNFTDETRESRRRLIQRGNPRPATHDFLYEVAVQELSQGLPRCHAAGMWLDFLF